MRLSYTESLVSDMSSTSLVSDQKQTHDERKRLVVLVDDDRNLCDLVERFLERADHRVVVFHDGESFLAALGAMMPDAICLDLSMPGIGGFETLELEKVTCSRCPTPSSGLVSELVGLEFAIERRSTDTEDAHDLGEIAVGLDPRLFDGTPA